MLLEKIFALWLLLFWASESGVAEHLDYDLETANELFEVGPGFEENNVKEDMFSTGFSQLFSSGDARRWAALNLAYQISCYQGREGDVLNLGLWVYKRYNGYGCYCGGGLYHGNYLDATDLCCKHHDICYHRVRLKYGMHAGCQTYTTPYTVSCCKEQKTTKCTDSGPSASREMCECDQAMSRCVAEHNADKTYNPALKNDRSKCKATGKSTKVLGLMDILLTCEHYNKPTKSLPLTYGPQGKCPKSKKTEKKGGWFFIDK